MNNSNNIYTQFSENHPNIDLACLNCKPSIHNTVTQFMYYLLHERPCLIVNIRLERERTNMHVCKCFNLNSIL